MGLMARLNIAWPQEPNTHDHGWCDDLNCHQLRELHLFFVRAFPRPKRLEKTFSGLDEAIGKSITAFSALAMAMGIKDQVAIGTAVSPAYTHTFTMPPWRPALPLPAFSSKRAFFGDRNEFARFSKLQEFERQWPDEETGCSRSPDQQHCNHWYDNEWRWCCYCLEGPEE